MCLNSSGEMYAPYSALRNSHNGVQCPMLLFITVKITIVLHTSLEPETKLRQRLLAEEVERSPTHQEVVGSISASGAYVSEYPWASQV